MSGAPLLPSAMQITPLTSLASPLGGEQIELQQVEHDAGGMRLLRVRIRERKRFTIIDIDPATAGAWGAAMLRWAGTQPGGGPGAGP